MSNTTTPDRSVAGTLARAVSDFGLADDPSDVERSALRKRRGYDADEFNGLASLSLVDDAGLLRWIYQPASRGGSSRRARRSEANEIGSTRVHSFSFRSLSSNQVIQAFEKLDAKLNPSSGLRRLVDNRLEPVTNATFAGRVLLFVHGIFSSGDMYLDELSSTVEGMAFLAEARTKYDAILVFDHPTVAVSPWINALDLEVALAGVTATIDVVAHSRGGVVTAWWLRNAPRNVKNVILVGAPMAGSSLAAPAKLRQALDMMANTVRALEVGGAAASTLLPLMGGVAGIAKIVGGGLRLGARTPLIDAGVAIVPGFAGVSRVSNNAELIRLSEIPWASAPTLHSVLSNFEPVASGAPWWQFWQHFRGIGAMLLDSGADAIFGGGNDLVVDTASMTFQPGKAVPVGEKVDFGTNGSVHHCNYFRQPRTIDLMHHIINI